MRKSNLRKSRNSQKSNVLIFILLVILGLLVYNLISKETPQQEQQITTPIQIKDLPIEQKNEIILNREIAKVELSENIIQADKIVEQISNQIELILLSEKGTYGVQYDRQEDKWYNGLNDSKLSLQLAYEAILVMPTDKISIQNKLGKLVLVYDENDIYCKLVEISDPLVKSDKGLFGSNYTSVETANIIDIEKNKIKNGINTNQELRDTANKNLINYFQQLCDKLDVELSLDNQIDNNLVGFQEIQYNHPNEIREETKYLVIHTTNNYSETATAQSHWNYWNSNPTANASANFVIDNKEVVECVDIDKMAWHVPKNEWMPEQEVFSYNSIGIEMCNNIEFEKSMGNTVEFIRSYILPLYPDIKIVRHSDANGKQNCPAMEDIEWENFLKEIYE